MPGYPSQRSLRASAARPPLRVRPGQGGHGSRQHPAGMPRAMPPWPEQSEGPSPLVPLAISRPGSKVARQAGRNPYPRGGGPVGGSTPVSAPPAQAPARPSPDRPGPSGRLSRPPPAPRAGPAASLPPARRQGIPARRRAPRPRLPRVAGPRGGRSATRPAPSRSAIHGRPLLMAASPGHPCPVGLPRAGLVASRPAFSSPPLTQASSRTTGQQQDTAGGSRRPQARSTASDSLRRRAALRATTPNANRTPPTHAPKCESPSLTAFK